MNVTSIESDYLAPFIVLDVDLETIPESFRGQPNNVFEISFEAYLEFIELYLGSVNWLATPTAEIKATLRLFRQEKSKMAEKTLFRFFQRDVAFAIFKELHFCAVYGMEASNIIHTEKSDKRLTIEFVEGVYSSEQAQGLIYEINEKLTKKKFPVNPESLSIRNLQHWKYAVALYYLSTTLFDYWSYAGTKNIL